MQLAMIVRGAQLRLERWAWTASGGDATLRLLLQPLGSKTRCTKRACSQGSHLIGLMRVLSCDRWGGSQGPCGAISTIPAACQTSGSIAATAAPPC